MVKSPFIYRALYLDVIVVANQILDVNSKHAELVLTIITTALNPTTLIHKSRLNQSWFKGEVYPDITKLVLIKAEQ